MRETAPPVRPAGRLSFGEELFWLIAQARLPAITFLECPQHLSIVLRFEGPLQRHALRASLDAMVRRHAVLRSRFIDVAGVPHRRTAPFTPMPLAEIDLRRLPESRQGPLVDRLLAAHVDAPFDLEAGPLLRAFLLTLGDTTHVFALTVHHLVFDDGSRWLLATELAACYDAGAGGVPIALPALEATYDDYVARQRARLRGGAGDRLMRAWQERLGGADDLHLPRDRRHEAPHVPSAPAEGSTLPGFARFTISGAAGAALRALGRQCRVTLATTMLALFAAWLHEASGSTDIRIGLPIADRRERAFESLVGLFANLLVVRIRVDAGSPPPQVIERARVALQQAHGQQDLPYPCFVRRQAALTGQPAVAPFRVAFNFMNAGYTAPLMLSGLRVQSLNVGHRPVSLADLSLHVRERRDELWCHFLYKAALFSPARAAQFAQQFEALCARAIEMPSQPLARPLAQPLA